MQETILETKTEEQNLTDRELENYYKSLLENAIDLSWIEIND